MRWMFLLLTGIFIQTAAGQISSHSAAQKWADSVYNSLNEDERIGQLIVTRLSKMDVKTKKITFFNDLVKDYVKRYNLGGLCIFQGGPELQAGYLNEIKAMAKTPILISIDGEWGVGMRLLDSIIPLPKQMMLGAMKDSSIVYQYGKVVAEQCKRMGIQMNYAPVMDVNNNADNPVINDRSFGEDKYKVASFGIQYMKGMQDMGILACAKHFPGHGDVAVDSHFDLPVINKSRAQLDSIELFPFKQIFDSGVGSVMIAHLFIPAIDDRPNLPSSLSGKTIQGLLKKELNYQGLTITDGLEMVGVKKFFPGSKSSIESLVAGNDLLCLPDSIPTVIEDIKLAIKQNKLSWDEIENHCKRVLMAKYQYVLPENKQINLQNLTQDLNKDVIAMKKLVAVNAITLLSKEDHEFFPLTKEDNKQGVAYVAIGINSDNPFSRKMQQDYNAVPFYFDFNKKNPDSVNTLINQIVSGYKKVVIGIHQINRAPLNNFGMSKEAVGFINALQQKAQTITFLFGNPYAAKNWCYARNLVVCYEDDSTVQYTAIEMLQGKLPYKGALPVTVCENFKFGYGIFTNANAFPLVLPATVGLTENKINSIDSIVADAVKKKALPGCVVLAAKDGKVFFEKGYGYYTYDKNEPVTPSSVYDLASLTKVLSTTLAVMKMYEEGKIDLKKKLGDYLPSVIGTNKENIPLKNLLIHEAGLKPYIPFYKETLEGDEMPSLRCYATINKDCFSNCVAPHLYLRCDLVDTFYHRILESPVADNPSYVYSDNDFIFLGKVVEKISGMGLNEYVRKYFYQPMGLSSLLYLPLDKISYDRIVPSTKEINFRNQELRGYVHDQGSAIMGGVAGHAGLFGDAYDIACIMQLLLNGGEWNGQTILQKETIQLFTSYQSTTSRRGYGFDKPEKDNATRQEPYPSAFVSEKAFGHTGFTGTCTWADPERGLIFVFLSNRIYPQDNGVFKTTNIRSKIMDCFYEATNH